MSETANQESLRALCRICSQLSHYERGFQKGGREEEHTFIPDAESHLIRVKDLKPNNNRRLEVKQCPECKTYYLYTTDYEYLANGSEDEQILERMTEEEAVKFLTQPVQL